jgi:hypothetical protein
MKRSVDCHSWLNGRRGDYAVAGAVARDDVGMSADIIRPA